MENYIITISRRFASRGHEIANLVSQDLGIPVYDRSAVEARVQSLQSEAASFDGADRNEEGTKEKPRQDGGTRSLLMNLFRREMREEIRDEAQLEFERQSEVIRSLVREGPCIILGRCADQIFEEYPRQMLHTGEAEARALIQNEDRAREAYRRRFSSHPEDEVTGRHILIDSGKLGARKSADLLTQAAKYLFLENPV